MFSIEVITSYRYSNILDSFKPFPEWDVITTTAMHIKSTRNKKKLSDYDKFILNQSVRNIYGRSDPYLKVM